MNICIIGYGRFGKLLTEILSPYGDIFLISRRKQTRKNGIKQVSYVDLREMDWIIPAVPISHLKVILRKINPYLKKGSLVMDVSSVKVQPCDWLKSQIKKEVAILGTHPMFGPDSAKYGLKGLQVIVCPLRITEVKLKKIIQIFQDLELKVIKTTPREHDKQVARSLAMVHFLGRVLGKMKIDQQEISSLGYERLLSVNETVNNDTWQLFWDMQKYNPETKRIRKQLIQEMINLNKKIENRRTVV